MPLMQNFQGYQVSLHLEIKKCLIQHLIFSFLTAFMYIQSPEAI